jgi:hypothetical protein
LAKLKEFENEKVNNYANIDKAMSKIGLFIHSIIKGDMLITKNRHNGRGYRSAETFHMQRPGHCECTDDLGGGHQ